MSSAVGILNAESEEVPGGEGLEVFDPKNKENLTRSVKQSSKC